MKRAGSRDCKNKSKLRREFNLSRYWNLSYFHTQKNNDDDAIKPILAAARDVLSARRVRHFKLVLALVSTETASRARAFPVLKTKQKFLKKKRKRRNKSRSFPPTERTRSGRGGASRGHRHLSYLSKFFSPRRPLRLEIPSAPFLSLSLPTHPLSLALSLPRFTSSSAAARATSFSCCSRSNMACAHVQSHVQIFTQPLCGRLRGQH